MLGLEAAEVNKRPYFYSQGKSRSLQSGMWKTIFLLLFFKGPSKAHVPRESSPRFSCHTRLLHSLKDKQCGLFCYKYQLLLAIVLCCSTIWFYVCVCNMDSPFPVSSWNIALSVSPRQEIFCYMLKSAWDRGSNLTGIQAYLGANGAFLGMPRFCLETPRLFCLCWKCSPHLWHLLVATELQWLRS